MKRWSIYHNNYFSGYAKSRGEARGEIILKYGGINNVVVEADTHNYIKVTGGLGQFSEAILEEVK